MLAKWAIKAFGILHLDRTNKVNVLGVYEGSKVARDFVSRPFLLRSFIDIL